MNKRIRPIYLTETDSTNRYLREYDEPWDDVDMLIASTGYQTSGHGQGTNTWESERGKNLLMSMKVRPKGVPANRQYIILQAAALAVRDTLARYADGMTIKWPNDIYHGDRKISGTLIECNVSHSMVTECIIGIGVNINQEVFTGNAPNPVSLSRIIGHKESVKRIEQDIVWHFGNFLFNHINEGIYQHITDLYMHSLYRREGIYPYRDADGSFMASIEDVMPDGHLVLRREDGTISRYAFKEVESIIPAISKKEEGNPTNRPNQSNQTNKPNRTNKTNKYNKTNSPN